MRWSARRDAKTPLGRELGAERQAARDVWRCGEFYGESALPFGHVGC